MTPEEVQKLLYEQRTYIMADVSAMVAAAIRVDNNRKALNVAVTQLHYNPAKKDALIAEIGRLRKIVQEKDWPENWE